MKPVALITGAGGLIGSYLVRAAATAATVASEWQVYGLSRRDLDLTDAQAVRRRFKALHPSLVIHCAAMSKTTQCRQDPALARRVNVEATARLAELARDIPFIFFSSDLVFDGKQGRYVETDPVSPINIYGETKVAAEQWVLANPRHTVIRTSLTAGRSPTGDRSFVEEMRRALEAGQPLTLFTDEYRCPIPASATARAVWELVPLNCPGLYHLAGAERLSRWEIGRLLAARWPELKADLRSGSVKDYPGGLRAADASLVCAKIQALLSFPLPGFTEWGHATRKTMRSEGVRCGGRHTS
jgi:dTDP-4-dehydrorhamnose reductase